MDKEKIKRYKDKYELSLHKIDEVIHSYIQSKCKKEGQPKVNLKWNDIDNVNGNCSKKEGDEYAIYLYLYTPLCLESYLKEKGCIPEYIDIIIEYIIIEIYLHEYFHILYGHCTISEEDEKKIPNEIKKQMEYACDMKALDLLFTDMDILLDQNKSKLGEYMNYFSTVLASIFVYFRYLEENEINNMKEKLGTDEYKTYTDSKRTHPFITFRYEYMRFLIENHLEKTLKCFGTNFCIEMIFKSSYMMIENFNQDSNFKINPFWRRNKKEINNIYNINFDEINKYCKIIYIDDLNY